MPIERLVATFEYIPIFQISAELSLSLSLSFRAHLNYVNDNAQHNYALEYTRA